MKKPENVQGATPLERLAAFTKKLIAVPREDVAAKEREYKTQRREKNGRRAK